ncbi:MAG: hypothetical protein NTW51_01420 [Cyanobacteria bacterium]|nr:hypothetical protein [Cyanobacteriota bacterium]
MQPALGAIEGSSTEICDRLITAALRRADGLLERMRREYSFIEGPINMAGLRETMR